MPKAQAIGNTGGPGKEGGVRWPDAEGSKKDETRKDESRRIFLPMKEE